MPIAAMIRRNPASQKQQQYRGAERDRTVGLLSAIQALSQLSYSPIAVVRDCSTAAPFYAARSSLQPKVVRIGGWQGKRGVRAAGSGPIWLSSSRGLPPRASGRGL